MTTRIYKVLVVDDSAFMRKIISDLISEDPRFSVVATAKNGKEGVEKAKELSPDVITMDVEMPEMNGLDAVCNIMKICPAPVVMLSSLTNEGASETIRALELGAVDFIRKPSGSISLDLYKVRQQLLDKLICAVQAKVSRIEPAARPLPKQLPPRPAIPIGLSNTGSTRFEHVVAIGTSTGGPRALQEVLSRLPRNLPAPILIVQHMPPKFTQSLAQRLDSLSEIRVVEAQDRQEIVPGTAYIAPGGWHMRLAKEGAERWCIHLDKEEPRSGHRPSVDILFESLVPHRSFKRHAVIMTGMGSDGAKGMQALKKSGAVTTIAESEKTCVVYGMPRSAVELQCVDYVVPLPDIASQIIAAIGGS